MRNFGMTKSKFSSFFSKSKLYRECNDNKKCVHIKKQRQGAVGTRWWTCIPGPTNGRIRWSFHNEIFKSASEGETAAAAWHLYTRNNQWFEMIDPQFGNTLKANATDVWIRTIDVNVSLAEFYLWLELGTFLRTSGENSRFHLDWLCCKLITIRLRKEINERKR